MDRACSSHMKKHAIDIHHILSYNQLRENCNRTKPINMPSTGRFHRVLQAICLFVMAFCTYGLFAFFPTSLTKQSDTISPSLTSVSANVPFDTLSSLTHSVPAEKRYITKSIQDIVHGDTVYTTTHETGKTASCHAAQPSVNTAVGIHRLTTMSESDDVQTFGVTAGHPYFVLLQNNIAYDKNLWSRTVRFTDEYGNVSESIDIANDSSGCYLAASDLRPGDQLLGPSGELSTVQYNQYEPHPECIPTYNFEVEYAHNYFILAQNDPDFNTPSALVHNMCAKNRKLPFGSSSGNFNTLPERGLETSLGQHPHDFKALFVGKKQVSRYKIQLTPVNRFRDRHNYRSQVRTKWT